MKIVISSGHGTQVRGASGYIDEVDEAIRLMEAIANDLRLVGVDVVTFTDTVSTSQNENLNRIVDFHNSQGPHDYDVSVHFNAYDGSAHGTECCYVSQEILAEEIATAIAGAGGFTNRGPKYRGDLFFLNNTAEKAVLLEVCFVDHREDTEAYDIYFDEIATAIAKTLSGEEKPSGARPEIPQAGGPLFQTEGKVSYFGGPEDEGVSASEGLAFIYEYSEAPWLFLEEQPPGTTGLARRLNPDRPYVACRWDYDVTPKEMLKKPYPALVRAPDTGRQFLAWPSDWGPHENTGRVADISPGLMERLGIETDDVVEVIYPAPVLRHFEA